MNPLANVLFGIDTKSGTTKFGASYISAKYRKITPASEIDFKKYTGPKAGPANFIMFYDDKAITFTYQQFFYCQAREKGDKKSAMNSRGRRAFPKKKAPKMMTAFSRGKFGFRVKLTKKNTLQFLYFKYASGCKYPSKYWTMQRHIFLEKLKADIASLVNDHISVIHGHQPGYISDDINTPHINQSKEVIKDLFMSRIFDRIKVLEDSINGQRTDTSIT